MPELWTVDVRTRKIFGPFEMVSLNRKGGGQSAHHVSFPDGRGLRVLPDGPNSGKRRGMVLASALTDLMSLIETSAMSKAIDPVTYVIGVCTRSGLKWDLAGSLREVPITEWLTEWFTNDNDVAPHRLAGFLIDDLKADGWAITRKGGE